MVGTLLNKINYQPADIATDLLPSLNPKIVQRIKILHQHPLWVSPILWNHLLALSLKGSIDTNFVICHEQKCKS